MKFLLAAITAMCLMSVAFADDAVDRIYQEFCRGEINKAQNEFKNLPQIPVRDGNRLFITALLESDGRQAAELLQACLRTDLDGKYKEEAHFRLIQLAQAENDTGQVLSSGNEFLGRWEMSAYRAPLLAAMAAFSLPGTVEQKRYFDLLTDGFAGTYYGQYARMAGAEAAFRQGHYKTATTMCRRINNAADENLAPASLILLSRIALAQGESERALLNYNILSEQYPHAIGQEELLDELKAVSDRQSGQESTEIFEGITYSVQVGVFGEKNNAENMSERVNAYGYKARIKKRTISDNLYYVVLAGKFRTMKEAEAARQKLETGENEVFKVVVNDEK